MAIKFFKSIDLTHNELQNAKLHLTGSAPQADEGKIYFDTGSNTVKIYVDYAEPGVDTWETVAFQSWVNANFNNYSLPLAASGTRGGVQIGYTTDAANRNYAVALDSEQMYVNVPWTDTVDMGAGFSVSADTDTNPTTIVEGETLTITGGTSISTETTADGTVTITNDNPLTNATLLTALSSLESANGSGINENITIGASAGDTIVITGNLTVQGTTTTLNTETVTIEDNIILLNSNVTGTGNGTDAGIEVERGDDTNVSLFWDESESAWTVTNTSGNYQILQSVGGTTFKVDLDAAESSVSKATNRYTVTHSLGTKDVIIQVVDISDSTPTYETVFTENQRPTTNTVTIAFANTVTDGHYRVLISRV